MKIFNAQFKTSVIETKNMLVDLVEVAFVGKSNSGKSSLINALANNKSLAYVGKTPGKTKMLNYFIVNKPSTDKTKETSKLTPFYFVDLPGYGYSQMGKAKEEKVAEIVETYFGTTKQLKHVFILCELKAGPSLLDLQMVQMCVMYNFAFSIVATKIDKLNQAEIRKSISEMATYLKIGIDNIIPVSSKDKKGLEKVLEKINM